MGHGRCTDDPPLEFQFLWDTGQSPASGCDWPYDLQVTPLKKDIACYPRPDPIPVTFLQLGLRCGRGEVASTTQVRATAGKRVKQ
jgi:hypothetical protein